MKFLLDNNLSKYLSIGMQGFGENVMHLKDVFPENTDDATLLKYVGENELYLVTRDLNIRRRPAEIDALKNYKVGAFF